MKNSIKKLTVKEKVEISGGELKDMALLGLYAASPFIGFTVAIGGYLLLTAPRKVSA